jgi:hypothetical protein
LPALAERGLRGEDNALRPRHLDEALDEALPRRIARLWRKGEVTPKVDAGPRHAKLELPCVEELERGCAAYQQVGVWREANVNALKPCRPSKPLSSGEQAHMPAMEPIKDPEGEDRPRSTLG